MGCGRAVMLFFIIILIVIIVVVVPSWTDVPIRYSDTFKRSKVKEKQGRKEANTEKKKRKASNNE